MTSRPTDGTGSDDDGAHDRLDASEAWGLLERHGAILSGHFRLSSGRHSDRYVEKARVFERPDATVRLAREIASWYDGVDVVVSPAVGAIALGFAVALVSGARFVFTERVDGRMALRRGFLVSAGERALVVEDVVTTGASAAEVYDLLASSGAARLGVASLVDRTQAPPPFPLRAVLRVDAVSWDPTRCPLCREGRPIEAPGSRHIAPGTEPSSRG